MLAAGTDSSPGATLSGGNVTFQNDTVVMFALPAGQGVGHPVSISVGGQASSYRGGVALVFSYLPPYIRRISPVSGATRGGYILSIFGENFGVDAVSVTLGGRPCTLPSQSHDLVQCRVPQGLGQGNEVRVTVIDRTSNAAIFNYSKPSVYTIVPNVPDANGVELKIVGVNFGWEPTPTAVLIGDKTCDKAVWLNDATLECSMQRDVAGPKNVTISVAGQTVQLVGPFLPQCAPGFYGQVGELCLACPQGGICTGGFAEPYASEGWWEVAVSTALTAGGDEGADAAAAAADAATAGGRLRRARRRRLLLTNCPPERQATRSECPLMIPCEPRESCTGNNTCAFGYNGERCGDCVKGTHYRLGGECVECPDNPEMIVIMFLVAALMLCIGGYVLNRKKVNLAFMSIGVDYFQVLALFATSKVQWPDSLCVGCCIL